MIIMVNRFYISKETDSPLRNRFTPRSMRYDENPQAADLEITVDGRPEKGQLLFIMNIAIVTHRHPQSSNKKNN